jgi:hypothetical protein
VIKGLKSISRENYVFLDHDPMVYNGLVLLCEWKLGEERVMELHDSRLPLVES